jgi:ribosomal protein RSM22 (predicted rRNA methylase)
MTWIVPPELEIAVYAAAREVLGDAPLATAALTRAIVDRSERYTSDRDRLAKPADRTADLAARAVFFTIADAIKIAIPLGELRGRDALPAPLRVLDVGAGCGALTLGLLATVSGPVAITALDRDADALAIAKRAVHAYRGVELDTRTADVTKATLPPADLVVIGTLLNELPAAARLPLVERALRAMSDAGAVILVEPALRDTTRALHELRDAILARELAHVFAPCTRRGAPCPMLANEADWCHEDRAVKLPPRTAELARLTHLRDGNLKFSYLVLRRAPAPLVAAGGTAWRVVGAPRAPKGKVELDGCSDAGLVPIRLLRRHRTPANRDVERAHRGDVLVIDRAPGDERLELAADTRVERIAPATSST